MSSSISRFLAALVVALLPAALWAQAGSGSITGIVRDSSGGAVPGATVRLVHEASGRAVDTVSDGEGGFTGAALEPGAYRLNVVLDGFETVERRLVVTASQPLVADVTLEPSRLTDTVVVTDAAARQPAIRRHRRRPRPRASELERI